MESMLSRRRFLEVTAGGALALGCDAGSGGERPRGTGPRSIVLVTGDDLGWLDLSSYGSPNVRTPNLDRLKRGGVSFRRAFDVTSTCSSSRTTYATGQYPHTHGVVGLVHRLPALSLPEGTPTLASHLRAAGLHTAIHGKWHLAFPQGPETYGYDEVMTSLLTQWIFRSDDSVDFVQRHAKDRFYFEINYMNPHRNYQGRFEQHPDHPVDPAAIVVPAYTRLPDLPGAREELAAYYSQVMRMDAMVGDLVAALEGERLLDDTLIVFISDNGMPFPGNKCNVYDRGTGTPLFFHWPAGFAAGVERDDLVASVDLMPTLLDVVGAPIPPEVQGRSLLPLLVDPAARGADAVFAEMTRHEDPLFPMRSVRTATHRYVRNYSDVPTHLEGGEQAWVVEYLATNPADCPWGKPRVPEELYDLTRDPNETVNLVDDAAYGGLLAELRARLDAHMTETRDPYLGRAFERTADAP